MLQLSVIKRTSGNVLLLLRLLDDQLLAVERHLRRLLGVGRRLDRLRQALKAVEARARVAAAAVARLPALARGCGRHVRILERFDLGQKCAAAVLVAADVGFEFFDDGVISVAAVGGEDGVRRLGHQCQLLSVFALLDVLQSRVNTTS